MLGVAAVTALGGAVSGMMVGDALGSIATTAAVPATSNSAKAKATANGQPVNPAPSAKQSLWHSAFIVVAAIAVLLLGSRALRDARIA